MSCILGRSHISADYTPDEKSLGKSIEVGDSQVIWKEIVDGTELTGK